MHHQGTGTGTGAGSGPGSGIRSAPAPAPDPADRQDFDDADRGFIGTYRPLVIRDATGRAVWDAESFHFLEGEAPGTVHPSLWRQSMLTAKHGLFAVTESIYQVRGFDISNVTFVEGESGIIVIDPLLSTETAEAAIRLYREHRGDRPVRAVIYTHSHVDHFGGVLGVVSAEAVARGEVQVIAPAGFLDHAVAENVSAGTAMSRRAGYMYGAALPRGPRGLVGAGLGPTTSTGEIAVIPPTLEIHATGERIRIDGVEIEFQVTPGTEAPAEMNFFFPEWNALCVAENASHTLHNVLTLRGALVRDAHAWAAYLTETLDVYGERAEVSFGSHHWPTWGNDRVRHYLSVQRDTYAYLHDETLRLINRGYQGTEIAEMIQLPPALEREWSVRGYYGSVSHNVKAIYQRYLGWFDANPVNLNAHPPVELGKRYTAAMGGVDRVLGIAREAVAAGDLRWAATVLGHAVFADPDREDARARLADVLEQLGFAAENGTWRNFYLAGAHELREGVFGTPMESDTRGMSAHVSPSHIFDSLAIAIEGPRAWDLDLQLDFVFTDLGERHRLELRNGVLVHRPIPDSWAEARGRIELTKPRLLSLVRGDVTTPGLVVAGDAVDQARLLAGVVTQGDPDFPIVTP